LSTDSYGIPDLTCCDGSELLVYATQVYAGYTLANDGNQAFEGDEGQGYTGGFDDSNTSGVPVDVLTGLEIGIPLAKIGYGMAENEGFNIFVAQMPNGCSAPRGQFSNQTLPAADEAAGFCDPPQMFPLRADMSSFTSVHSVAQVSDLPAFGGVADGVIVPADYSGAADELQTCPVADSVVDGTVSLVPDAIQGEDVTVWYVSTNGPLEGSAEVYLNYDFDDAATPYANRVLMVATNGLTGSEWIATVTMDTGALQFDVYFDDGVTTDDNTGQNWHFAVGRAATGPAVVIVPDPATAGLNVTVTYDPIGRVLEGADAVSIHYGFNSWSSGVTDAEMTRQTDCTWEVTFQVSDLAGGPQGLSMVFFEPGGAWDNNDGNNWHFEVTPQGEPPFNMDGELDSCAVLVAINGDGTRHLYAGLLDGWLYVATEAAQANNDHFIFLSTNGPVAQTPAPWGKSGTVGEHDGFLAQEVGNGWNGWQDGLDGLSGPASMDNDVLEGQINLATQFVNYPSTIFMAMGAWGNDNEDPLRPELQIPEGNGDLNIDADEYIEVTPSLDPDPADFDEDCDVDLVDYAAFQACLNGPNNPPAGGCAVDADFDDDGDVDLKDFAEFQVAFTG
ncbi:MAG: hypothetical protein KAV82_16560, partial [Phycisphaerae bacterium]|nr:hypothetical protein [Phycisphaerae bacterium]